MTRAANIANLPFHTTYIKSLLPKKEVGNGTGFLVEFSSSPGTYLITNRHVVEGALETTFTLPLQRPNPGVQNVPRHEYQLGSYSSEWTCHSDPKIDLCCCRVDHLFKQLRPYFVPVKTSKILASASLQSCPEVSEVLIIGYPIGLWDRQHVRPIIRRGTTATHPGIDFDYEREFIIDAACVPGSSGSPVFRYPELYQTEADTIDLEQDLKLIGILYAAYYCSREGDISFAPIPANSTATTDIHIHLGKVIPSHLLLDFQHIMGTPPGQVLG